MQGIMIQANHNAFTIIKREFLFYNGKWEERN